MFDTANLRAARKRIDYRPKFVPRRTSRQKIASSFGVTSQATFTIDDEAMEALRHHTWPGNIRELRNVLERAKLYADDQVIHRQYLALKSISIDPPVQPDASPPAGVVSTDLNDAALRARVQQHRGSRRELALKLGLSERTLYRRLGALGLKGVTGDD